MKHSFSTLVQDRITTTCNDIIVILKKKKKPTDYQIEKKIIFNLNSYQIKNDTVFNYEFSNKICCGGNVVKWKLSILLLVIKIDLKIPFGK